MQAEFDIKAAPLDGIDHSDYPASPWWRMIEDTIASLSREELVEALEASVRDRKDSMGGEFSHDLEYAIKKRIRQTKD